MPLLVIVLFTSLLVIEALSVDNSLIDRVLRLFTDGTMGFSVRTVTYNGPYAPRNAGVIWVTNAQNQFVKTIKVWANTYRWTLVRWIGSSGQNTTGAVTSASLNSHQLHNVTWNGKNWQNMDMPDGEYKVNVEFTEHNATVNNMGKYRQVSFIKGSEPVDLTIPNETYFRDMRLTWTPVISTGTLGGLVTNMTGDPIPNASITTGGFNTLTNVDGSYTLSLPIGYYDVQCSADGYLPLIVNHVQINGGQTTVLNFSLAPVSNADDTGSSPPVIFPPPLPNPATSETRLRIYTKSNERYEIRILNLRGQQVRHFHGKGVTRGWQELRWDLRDQAGRLCPSGTYLLVCSSGDKTYRQSVKIIR